MMIDPDSYLNLTELNARLVNCCVTAKQLARMGFIGIKGAEVCKLVDCPEFTRKYRSAVLYKHSDMPAIKAAIAQELGSPEGEAWATGVALRTAQKRIPAGYSLVLRVSQSGRQVHIEPPNSKRKLLVPSEQPLSRSVASATECARALAASQLRIERKNYS